jgi:hypothetical protein
MPMRGRRPTLARALSGASGACAAPTARPAARATPKVASAVVRLWVAGRRSGRDRAGHAVDLRFGGHPAADRPPEALPATAFSVVLDLPSLTLGVPTVPCPACAIATMNPAMTPRRLPAPWTAGKGYVYSRTTERANAMQAK